MAHAVTSPTSQKYILAIGALVLGWAVLYGPVYIEFANGLWLREENAHAPFIMAICLGTAWARLRNGGFTLAPVGSFAPGVAILLGGLLLYVLGRAGEVTLFVSGSQTLVATGAVISLIGLDGVRRLWFPLALSLYLIIWPGWALDLATAPLKLFVSETVSTGLFAAGMPVAHSGAIIAAGPYELLVADACAGLNSLIALTAVGAVYLYAVRRKSLAVTAIVAAALIPLAIFANLVRVGLLVLLTYYGGHDVGQSFLHESAGLLMFAVALGGVFMIDSIAAFFLEPKP